jgi:hypothetical protein
VVRLVGRGSETLPEESGIGLVFKRLIGSISSESRDWVTVACVRSSISDIVVSAVCSLMEGSGASKQGGCLRDTVFAVPYSVIEALLEKVSNLVLLVPSQHTFRPNQTLNLILVMMTVETKKKKKKHSI